MTGGRRPLPDWERLLAAERHLQALVPGAMLVGGTAAALHAEPRRSQYADHVVADLRERFDDVLAALEAASGWRTERVQRPVPDLGGLDGVATGIRQLRRVAPLEVETIEGLTMPTLPEQARIKAWLLATRNTLRDYLDLVVLLERLGDVGAAAALASLDDQYPQPSCSVTVEVVEWLASAAPVDLAEVELSSYKGLVPPWNDWTHVEAKGRHFAEILAEELLLSEGRAMSSRLERSRALWNRSHLDLRSEQTLAQILDRGDLEDWRELYRLAREDAELRRRLVRVVGRVPIGYPYFWRSALRSLGEPIDLDASLPEDPGWA